MIYVKNFVLNNKVKSQSDKKFIKQTKGDKDGNMEVCLAFYFMFLYCRNSNLQRYITGMYTGSNWNF